MFGKRTSGNAALKVETPKPEADKDVTPEKSVVPKPDTGSAASRKAVDASDAYYETKATIFNALFETIDVSALAGMQPDAARAEIRTIVDEIIAIRNVSC